MLPSPRVGGALSGALEGVSRRRARVSNGEPGVIPSGGPKGRSRGIAGLLVEGGPLYRQERDSSTSRVRSTRYARNDSRSESVKQVLGHVRHSHLLANEVAGIGRCRATDRVHALDELHAMKHARTVGDRGQQEPGNGVRVRRTAVHDRADQFAAAVALPDGSCRSRVVRADDAVPPGVGRQDRRRPDKAPGTTRPSIDLDAVRVDTEGERTARGRTQVVTGAEVYGAVTGTPGRVVGGE